MAYNWSGVVTANDIAIQNNPWSLGMPTGMTREQRAQKEYEDYLRANGLAPGSQASNAPGMGGTNLAGPNPNAARDAAELAKSEWVWNNDPATLAARERYSYNDAGMSPREARKARETAEANFQADHKWNAADAIKALRAPAPITPAGSPLTPFTPGSQGGNLPAAGPLAPVAPRPIDGPSGGPIASGTNVVADEWARLHPNARPWSADDPQTGHGFDFSTVGTPPPRFGAVGGAAPGAAGVKAQQPWFSNPWTEQYQEDVPYWMRNLRK